jgi:hypothetical protein
LAAIASAAVAPSVVTPKDTVAMSGVAGMLASPITVIWPVASAKTGTVIIKAKAEDSAAVRKKRVGRVVM